MSVLLLGSLLPSVSFAQDGGLERHLSRGEGLYRMEKYGEAFMEFGKAGRYAAVPTLRSGSGCAGSLP